MLKKLISIAVVAVMVFSLFLFASCSTSKKEFEEDRIEILVKLEYKDKFLSEEFSLADFGWDNAERIEYRCWYERFTPEIGYMILFLKKHGKKQVYAAIEHCSNLDFVYEASVSGFIYAC